MRLFAGTKFDIPPTCDRCQRLEEECQCPPLAEKPAYIEPQKQVARIAVEKRKKGKVVTVIRGLLASANDLGSLCTRLKNTCGAGGTVEGDEIEIQGEHAQRINEVLAEIGYRIKILNSPVKPS